MSRRSEACRIGEDTMYDVLEATRPVTVLDSFSELCEFIMRKAEKVLTSTDKMILLKKDEFSFYSEADGKRYTVKRNGVREDLF